MTVTQNAQVVEMVVNHPAIQLAQDAHRAARILAAPHAARPVMKLVATDVLVVALLKL